MRVSGTVRGLALQGDRDLPPPLLSPISLLTGKNTGNSAETGPSTSISMPSWRAKISRFPEFPTQRNREFTKSYQGIFLTVTGNRAQWAESRSAFCDQRKNSSV